MPDGPRTQTPGSGRPPRFGLLAVALVLVLLTVLGIALLYAYRAQPAASERVPFVRVMSELQDGQVRAIAIEGTEATVTLVDGRTQQVAAPGDDLTRAVLDHNRADPAHPVSMRYQPAAANPSLALVIAAGYLPLLLLVGLIVFAASLFRRSTAAHRYQALSGLADLRDRGAITEAEFQREKRRLLR